MFVEINMLKLLKIVSDISLWGMLPATNAGILNLIPTHLYWVTLVDWLIRFSAIFDTESPLNTPDPQVAKLLEKKALFT